MTGHWTCNECGEAVKLPPPLGRWDLKQGVACPLCHKKACEWSEDKPATVAPDRAAELFKQIKDNL
jgi:hypothetical protein